MASLWSERATIESWLRVEGELALAQAEEGVIPLEDAELIATTCAKLEVDRDRLWYDTRQVGYPILPLVNQIVDHLPASPAGYVHYGATTQDVMDTVLALQLVASTDRLQTLLMLFGDALSVLVAEHGGTVMAGRTHAQQAVPTTFGAKMSVFLEQIRAEREVLRRVRHEVGVISLFGAAGTSAAMGSAADGVRSELARRLDLKNVTVPWHVARGGIARFGQAMATSAAVCTRFAREIIDLSRTEYGEVRERSGHHRGASSTMPQKANPISCEAVVGLAVTATTLSGALLRGVEAGHERSAGEWQIEWTVLPSIALATAAAVALAADTAADLQVFPEVMRANLAADDGLVMSEAFMMKLAPVIGRDRAHQVVYEAASLSRLGSLSLAEEIRCLLPPNLRSAVVDLGADDYIGQAQKICTSAIEMWNASRPDADQEES